MINLTPIPTRIQERMREKMDALGRDTPYFPDSESPILTQEQMLSRSPFMKMVSGQKKPIILMGGELNSNGIPGGFDDIYGSRHDGNEHSRPMPGLKSMSATFQGGLKAHREASIQWTCWSFEDLDRLTPHFLAHGKTIMIQWGWVYDKNSLLNIKSYTDNNKIETDAFNSNHMIDIIDQSGDYDMMTGVIKNFSYTTRQDGGFDCETLISSIGVNLLSSTEGTISSIDPFITYDISKKLSNDKIEYKIKQAEDQSVDDGESSKLIKLNSSVSLKIFLKNINDYISEKLEEGDAKSITETETKDTVQNQDYDYTIKYTSNKYIAISSPLTTSVGMSGPMMLPVEGGDTWVRWGWFEDNILSKFLSVTSEDGTIVSEFRSIERDLEPDSLKPSMVKSKNGEVPVYSSTRIKSHSQMQTVSINDYILPGKFSPQSDSPNERIQGKTYNFPGDKDQLHSLANIINENFDSFEVEMWTGTKEQNLRLQKEMGDDYKKKDEESKPEWDSRRKKYYESNITGGKYG